MKSFWRQWGRYFYRSNLNLNVDKIKLMSLFAVFDQTIFRRKNPNRFFFLENPPQAESFQLNLWCRERNSKFYRDKIMKTVMCKHLQEFLAISPGQDWDAKKNKRLLLLQGKVLDCDRFRVKPFWKFEFEYRGMSRLKVLSGNSGPSRFHRRVQIQQFLEQTF